MYENSPWRGAVRPCRLQHLISYEQSLRNNYTFIYRFNTTVTLLASDSSTCKMTASTANNNHHHPSAKQVASDLGVPWSIAQPTLVAYRSIGIGLFGAVVRFMGMPLEKIALYMNSSQVAGTHPFRQAAQLTFARGAFAPYKVVGPASITAWFLQYSVMGVAFQFVDQTLSSCMNVRPVYYGRELMQAVPEQTHADEQEPLYQLKYTIKTCTSPVLAATLESLVSNRAEAQRYWGPRALAKINVAWAGPALIPSITRNTIMCGTTFIVTPMTYRRFVPAERKSNGLACNVFGNVAAITQQALWGRSLDYYLKHNGALDYRQVIKEGLATEGWRAFFTGPKWFSRVLMNAPAQGTLPWFYNEVLPLGEPLFLQTVKLLYDTFGGHIVHGDD
jgi:hypothetical protein